MGMTDEMDEFKNQKREFNAEIIEDALHVSSQNLTGAEMLMIASKMIIKASGGTDPERVSESFHFLLNAIAKEV